MFKEIAFVFMKHKTALSGKPTMKQQRPMEEADQIKGTNQQVNRMKQDTGEPHH